MHDFCYFFKSPRWQTGIHLVKTSSRNLYCVILVSPLLTVPAAAEDMPLFQSRVADLPSLATSGPSGTLNLPDGRTLSDGVMVFGYNSHLGANFTRFRDAKNFQFALGLLPHLEISARLAEMSPVPGQRGARDLSANVKFMLPRLFEWQPNVALGIMT
jgi:hypothetical protein